MTIDEQKKHWREQMLTQRAKLSQNRKKTYDQQICKTLYERIKKRNYQVIHAYLTMGMEIDILPLLDALLSDNRTVVTPKTLPKRKLQNLVLNDLNQVESGVFGTRHPSNSVEYIGNYDLIIVPGLAFDSANNRLGYGGGYYDNFMVNHSEAEKVGVFYPFQKIEAVPTEKHDLVLDEVLVFQPFLM